MTYKIHISDREYREYKIVNSHTLDYSQNKIEINPAKLKLFNQDIFDILDNGDIKVLHSSIKSMPLMVLVLNTKTCGKIKDKFLYEVYSDDRILNRIK